jgi:hypothetical protein
LTMIAVGGHGFSLLQKRGLCGRRGEYPTIVLGIKLC